MKKLKPTPHRILGAFAAALAVLWLAGCSLTNDAAKWQDSVDLYRGSLVESPDGSSNVVPLDRIALSSELLEGTSEVDITAEMQPDVSLVAQMGIEVARSRGANAGPLTEAEAATFNQFAESLSLVAGKKERFAKMDVTVRTYRDADQAAAVALGRVNALEKGWDRALDTVDRTTPGGILGNLGTSIVEGDRSVAGVIGAKQDIRDALDLMAEVERLREVYGLTPPANGNVETPSGAE